MASLPPQYSMDEVSAAPTYSVWPDQSELTITRDGLLEGSSSSQRYTFATKHMAIDLGPQIWGTAYPCYGRNARVEGAIRLSGTPSNVKRVSVTVCPRVTLPRNSPQLAISFRLWRALQPRLRNAALEGNMCRPSCHERSRFTFHSKQVHHLGANFASRSPFQQRSTSMAASPICRLLFRHGTRILVLDAMWRTL